MTSLSIISGLKARRIFNSRGEETIEVEVKTLNGFGCASAPSGKSRGKYEVTPFPEGGVEEAVRRVEKYVKPKILGLDADNQEEIDKILHAVDGTENFSFIGGNTAYAVSLAVAEASASTHNQPLFYKLKKIKETILPLPLGNVLGGGKHAGKGAPDIQEFLVLPLNPKSFFEAYKANVKVHSLLGEVLTKHVNGFTGGKGDEGAWAPPLTNEKALEIVVEVAEKISDEMGFKIGVGLDFASSSLWNPKKEVYEYVGEGKKRGKDEQLDYVLSLIEKFKLVYVEDPFHEDDFESFVELTSKAKNCLICGDDLFVTNKKKLELGVKLKAANSLIVKPNQVGTVSDTWETIKLAKASNYVPVISHRSGETTSNHIAHLAVAFGCPIIKTGVVGGERIAKLNELLRIEETLAGKVSVAKIRFG
ncbi:phosphopyruvate hydratase [Candidatus Bathyarchaeota archaeon]|nr:MAG: phosphopyruvate hydratase [Candidatus Bathyarchaeota archaeon]